MSLDLLGTARAMMAAAHERSLTQMRSLGLVRVTAGDTATAACPLCGGLSRVRKTMWRGGRTLAHGSFSAHETVYLCQAGCRSAEGRPITWRAGMLAEWLLPRSTVGYDVMAFVGVERYVHAQQREQVRSALAQRYGLSVSAGEVSRLGRLFLSYLGRLHEARADAIRAVLAADGGWPAHVDATGEDGRGTLFVVLAGWRGWVLAASKVPTERADAIAPVMRHAFELFGAPCAVMRDLGRAVTDAARSVLAEMTLSIPELACHLHLLRDVGSDLLERGHTELRALMRHYDVHPRLCAFARELGRELGTEIAALRAELPTRWEDWSARRVIDDGPLGLATVRSLAQWTLDYAADCSDQGFPFDLPWLNFFDRCICARRTIDAFLRTPPSDKRLLRAIVRLRDILEPTLSEESFGRVVAPLVRRAEIFVELRAALRLWPKPDGRNPPARPRAVQIDPKLAELQDVRKALEKLEASLLERRPQRGPARNTRDAIDLVLRHLVKHGPHLFGHEIAIPKHLGGGVRLVDRTNNALEGFFHAMKHDERRRSGRKVLTRDFEDLPATAAIARNLAHEDYVEVLCGSLDHLSDAFAALDQQRRSRALEVGPADPVAAGTDAPMIASASLSREDRALVRTAAMADLVVGAAMSRAPITVGRTRPGRAVRQAATVH